MTYTQSDSDPEVTDGLEVLRGGTNLLELPRGKRNHSRSRVEDLGYKVIRNFLTQGKGSRTNGTIFGKILSESPYK